MVLPSCFMDILDEARQLVDAKKPLDVDRAQALIAAYQQEKKETEQLRARVGDLEFHFEVFEHLMVDRKLMLETFAELGLEIFSVPDADKGSWGWAWRWRGSTPTTGYERSIHALIAAIETLLREHVAHETSMPETT
jgi:hypothetical protein